MIASRIAIILVFGIIVATLFTQKAMSRVSFFMVLNMIEGWQLLFQTISGAADKAKNELTSEKNENRFNSLPNYGKTNKRAFDSFVSVAHHIYRFSHTG